MGRGKGKGEGKGERREGEKERGDRGAQTVIPNGNHHGMRKE